MAQDGAGPQHSVTLEHEKDLSSRTQDRGGGIREDCPIGILQNKVAFDPIPVQLLECSPELLTVWDDPYALIHPFFPNFRAGSTRRVRRPLASERRET